MWVKAREGFVVRDPRTKKLIPAEGIEAPVGDFDFDRYLRDEDLVECAPPAAPSDAPSEPPPPVRETRKPAPAEAVAPEEQA